MSRYILNTEEQQKEMLEYLGIVSADEFFKDIPEAVRLEGMLDLPMPLSEMELVSHMKRLSERSVDCGRYACFLGAGAYDHYIPGVVAHIVSRQEFYTAYTPYQPEISQGTLQAIFEYQTMICELTGMDAANASMYDGATAAAEAAVLACRATRRQKVLAARTLHPESRRVLTTYSRFNGSVVEEVGYRNGWIDTDDLKKKLDTDTAAIIVQYPNFFGALEDVEEIARLAHANKSLFIAVVNPIALALLKPPGQFGADIAVGEGQPLGGRLSFGGPYFGFFAVKNELVRKMPGRVVGETTDSTGRRGYVLTLQAREQHIRREKATSNICSNQALNALAAAVYLTLMGKQGLRETAELCLRKAHYASEALTASGKFEKLFDMPFFNEFAVKSPVPVEELNAKLLESGIIGGYDLGRDYPELSGGWLLAVTEKRSREEIDKLVEKAGAVV